jgi:hypothetical protein
LRPTLYLLSRLGNLPGALSPLVDVCDVGAWCMPVEL